MSHARVAIIADLCIVVSAAVCAAAGHRSYTAIAEWVDDVPATTALTLGIDPDRRPSEAMIRRRRYRLDQPKRLTTETVYAITNLRVHQAEPVQLATWIRRHREFHLPASRSIPWKVST